MKSLVGFLLFALTTVVAAAHPGAGVVTTFASSASSKPSYVAQRHVTVPTRRCRARETRRRPTKNNGLGSSSFAGAFDIDQMEALETRGELELSLMQPVGILGDEGKRKKNGKKKQQKVKRQKASVAARTLFQEGVVRLDGILSETTASSLRTDILARRAAAIAAVELDSSPADEWRKYFADVLLKGHNNQRCDLLLPLKGNPPLQRALHELLVTSPLLHGTLVAAAGGRADATLYELAALVSEPGARRQPVHPDNPHQPDPPLHTVFVALQDVAAAMGPTTFLPRTHTAAAHAAFADVPHGRDGLLRAAAGVEARLRAGDAALFDARCLHCGGANDAAKGATRVLLYLSFRNPRAEEPVGNVGSRAPGVPRLTLAELRRTLADAAEGGSRGTDAQDPPFDPFDDEQEVEQAMGALRRTADEGDPLAQLQLGTHYFLGEAGFETDPAAAVRWFASAAAQGNARARFNLGFCCSTGQGLAGGRDLRRAAELLRLAAEQRHPGAQELYESTLRELEQVQEDA